MTDFKKTYTLGFPLPGYTNTTMAKGIMKFRCCAKAASTGNRCRNKTLRCQRVTALKWYEQPTSFCLVHTQAVITVQRWYLARHAINKAKAALKK